ncbi:response regulator [bacterium]|nr:response regulator [bacterium]
MTILVVDDEPDVLFYLETVLEDAGFNVMTASDGEEALEKVKEKSPDFISLDLVMPRKSGIRFYYELRRSKLWSKIPVVIVTGHAKDELGKKDLNELFEGRTVSGPKVYLEKPVKPVDFVNLIKKELDIPIEEGIEKVNETEVRKELEDLLKDADSDTLEKALEMLRKKK